jgi:hypothetical protein
MDANKKEKLKALGGKLANLAPYIAGVLGGPAAGAGVKILKDFLGADDEDSIEDLISVLPIEKVLELKKLDAEMRNAEASILMNAEDNVTRRLESDNLTDSKFTKNIRPALAVFWSLITAAVIVAGLYTMDPEKLGFYQGALFAVAGIQGAIIGFYYGGRSSEKITAIKNA